MKLLVTGQRGQVVTSLMERAGLRTGIQVVACGKPALDLLDIRSIETTIVRAKPDIVVSAAAYTAVDLAEDDPDIAFAINSTGAGAVAAAAAKIGAPVIHLSTDYVFSGSGEEPYHETDPTGPTSIYGHSKLAGELAVARANPLHVVLRTAWVYSPFGKNFVRTMLRLATENGRVRVVGDQRGNPTSALDIADGILDICQGMAGGRSADRYGTFHMAGSGGASWSDFAESIFAISRAAGGIFAKVESIPASAYPTRARRPANSCLSCEKLASTFGVRLPDWQTSLISVVERLVRDINADAPQVDRILQTEPVSALRHGA